METEHKASQFCFLAVLTGVALVISTAGGHNYNKDQTGPIFFKKTLTKWHCGACGVVIGNAVVLWRLTNKVALVLCKLFDF